MIGIISAMHAEIHTLVDALENRESYTKGMRNYNVGRLFNIDVVIVFSRWGKVASATTATQLINDFNIDEIIFTGVGGSICDNTNIGDIVIGKKLYQHDMNATPFVSLFEIPLLKKKYFETDSNKRESFKKASIEFSKNVSNYIDGDASREFNIVIPKIHVQDIASGDQFISSNQQIDFIKTNLPEVVCVEMEGAAVAQVCYEYEIPFSVIRTISDKADNNSHIDFAGFANNIASKYAKGILMYYFNEIR